MLKFTKHIKIIALLLLFMVVSPAYASFDSDLFSAVRMRDSAKTKILLESGTNVNAKWLSATAAAIIYAANMGYKDMVKLLIEKGVNVNLKSNTDVTVLMVAANSGQKDVVKLLISKGADIVLLQTESDKSISEISYNIFRKGGSREEGKEKTLFR